MNERQLMIHWQFNGNNISYCNQKCPYCYGGKRDKGNKHFWNNNIEEWREAFERLNRDIYFVFSYGEPMGAKGFYDCVKMIGEHENWTLNMITNLSYDPTQLINSRLGQEKRVFVTTTFHPLGVKDKDKAWENFKKNLLKLKDAQIPVQVMYVWYKPQIKLFPKYFEWLDKNDFRVHVRRCIITNKSIVSRGLTYLFPKYFAGKHKLGNYTKDEKEFLYLATSPKTTKYSLDLESTYGLSCSAGKDLILVEYDGTVKPCADCYGQKYRLGNIFDKEFKLNDKFTQCPINTCGGCYGMLHLVDDDFYQLPDKLWADTFVSQVEKLPQTSPIGYPNRKEMLKCLEAIKNTK